MKAKDNNEITNRKWKNPSKDTYKRCEDVMRKKVRWIKERKDTMT